VSDERPQAFQDSEGYTWLTAVRPDGTQVLFCYDTGAARRMGEAWPTLTREEAEAEFGALVPLVPDRGEE
jgi:hypothetical protein